MLSLHFKLFQQIKRGLELVFLPHFRHKYWRKIFVLLYSINWPNFIVWLPWLCEILGNMCIAIACKPCYDVMNFEVNFIFLIKPIFIHDQKVVAKLKYFENRKSFYDEIKTFLVIFKGLSIKQTTQFFWEGESPTLINYLVWRLWNYISIYLTSTYKSSFNYMTMVLQTCYC